METNYYGIAELKGNGIVVHGIYPGAVDTEMIAVLEMPKTAPAEVAAAILDAIAEDTEEIFPDAIAQQLGRLWLAAQRNWRRSSPRCEGLHIEQKEQRMMKIAFLGLGAMGARIAHNLLQAGYPLTVYNRSAERTAPLVVAHASADATPRSAAYGADVVISMVRDDEASREVWLADETGALHGMQPGAVAIEISTLSPQWVETQAEGRQLIVLAGGEYATLERVRPVLEALAGTIHHLGPIGAGSIMKLAVNTLFGIQVAAWAEMLAVLEQRGMAPAQAVDLRNSLPTTSPALQAAGRLMAVGSYAPLFPINLVVKDFGYALALAEEPGVHSPLLAAAGNVYAKAGAHGYGGGNIVGVKQLYDKEPFSS